MSCRSFRHRLFFDLSKAFNGVWQTSLLKLLHPLDLKDAVPKWRGNYLTHRRQHVRVRDTFSERQAIPGYYLLPRVHNPVPHGEGGGYVLLVLRLDHATLSEAFTRAAGHKKRAGDTKQKYKKMNGSDRTLVSFQFLLQGLRERKPPPPKNCAPDFPTFGEIAVVSPNGVQWRDLILREPPF